MPCLGPFWNAFLVAEMSNRKGCPPSRECVHHEQQLLSQELVTQWLGNGFLVHIPGGFGLVHEEGKKTKATLQNNSRVCATLSK